MGEQSCHNVDALVLICGSECPSVPAMQIIGVRLCTCFVVTFMTYDLRTPDVH